MVKVTILGSTGMLGNSVTRQLISNENFNVTTSFRKEQFRQNENSFYFDALTSRLQDLPDSDYIINCIGIIKPYMNDNPLNAIKINSLFPRNLANWCKTNNTKLIHITTDCVFSGQTGRYDESSLHDCIDEYGKSKSLGEPTDCMTIRTSIIGEEIHSNSSLIEWVKSQKGKTIKGFTNHFWNGVTTSQYGKICSQIITKNLYQEGLFHVHSDDLSKYELVSIINDVYDLGITIEPYSTSNSCDRTLRTNKELNSVLSIPTLKEQIISMKNLTI